MPKGEVYILINPSMPGLVKIGKTSRRSQDRVIELSAHTGIPSPFILIYHREFEDVDKAEKSMHSILEEQGTRNTSNREFFNITPTDAINLLVNLKDPVSAHIFRSTQSFQEMTNGNLSNNLKFEEGLPVSVEDNRNIENMINSAKLFIDESKFKEAIEIYEKLIPLVDNSNLEKLSYSLFMFIRLYLLKKMGLGKLLLLRPHKKIVIQLFKDRQAEFTKERDFSAANMYEDALRALENNL